MTLHGTGGGRSSLRCGCQATLALEAQDGTDAVDTATRNDTDVRRARQRARATIRELANVVVEVLAARELQFIMSQPQGDRRLNAIVSRTASQHIQDELLDWLVERNRITMGRAARAAFDQLQTILPDAVDQDDLVGQPQFTNADSDLLQELRALDAGLLTDEQGDSLASKVGDEVTRQVRVGLQNDEPVRRLSGDGMDLATRVDMVLNGPDYDRSTKQENGVTGQSIRTKGELIAHDSVQDAYNTAARRRYLQNGFRFVIYDATCDTRTTDLCRRLGECNGEPVVIDLVEDPHLVPPNHPYCRSGIRPTLEPPRDPITEDGIADRFLQDIWNTESYRPTIQDESAFQPTALTRQAGQDV